MIPGIVGYREINVRRRSYPNDILDKFSPENINERHRSAFS